MRDGLRQLATAGVNEVWDAAAAWSGLRKSRQAESLQGTADRGNITPQMGAPGDVTEARCGQHSQ